jgi:hypothetical protein
MTKWHLKLVKACRTMMLASHYTALAAFTKLQFGNCAGYA